jgi:hypothetical protein
LTNWCLTALCFMVELMYKAYYASWVLCKRVRFLWMDCYVLITCIGFSTRLRHPQLVSKFTCQLLVSELAMFVMSRRGRLSQKFSSFFNLSVKKWRILFLIHKVFTSCSNYTDRVYI